MCTMVWKTLRLAWSAAYPQAWSAAYPQVSMLSMDADSFDAAPVFESPSNAIRYPVARTPSRSPLMLHRRTFSIHTFLRSCGQFRD